MTNIRAKARALSLAAVIVTGASIDPPAKAEITENDVARAVVKDAMTDGLRECRKKQISDIALLICARNSTFIALQFIIIKECNARAAPGGARYPAWTGIVQCLERKAKSYTHALIESFAGWEEAEILRAVRTR